MNSVILPAFYFPPVQYFSVLISKNEIYIETKENYSKQSYRNRCNILTANGVESLVIPVKKISGTKQLITETEIDYKTNWQSSHFKAIETAYNSSPFYEFYIDNFRNFFTEKYKYLFDFNIKLLKTILEELMLEKTFGFTQEFTKNLTPDYRTEINPKEKYDNLPTNNCSTAYTQVFTQKFGFISNLSILDLLFNKGPESEIYLKKCLHN